MDLISIGSHTVFQKLKLHEPQTNCQKMFLEAIFFAFEKTFLRVSVQNFCHCFTWYHWPTKISHCLSANHYPELRCVICTGVTLFAPVLHFLHWCYTWTALLSANQNRVIFSCVLLTCKWRAVESSPSFLLRPFRLSRLVILAFIWNTAQTFFASTSLSFQKWLTTI